ncbi:TonB-dependent receptor domain-containing protein [Fibrella aquatilis]|uniref:TonB-dependent receptor n=1 Tax=Fibrella aquatilis TaxID=2817059 RepID=A0A939G8D0_9BACT|nr:TonB-dependent receptor [Fibrella aquatilis]MBO0932855.1 TonB-dependent receptor [Fibrella aquatilis]
MSRHVHYRILSTGLLLLLSLAAWAQTKLSGQVTDAAGQPLPGVSLTVKGKVSGTITDTKGNFNLSTNTAPPFTLIVTSVGFKTEQVNVTGSNANLSLKLDEQALLGQEVVVAASRVEESVMKSPVSIEKMDLRAIQNAAAPSFYDALRNLKGVEVSQQSLTFGSINTRGFTGNGNVRVVQMIDGMDNQAPGLNFAVGNIAGISELDLESVELLPGAASALYGPNATNGLLLMTSKSPFLYQGLSAQAKAGIMQASNRVNKDGSAQGATPFSDVAIRYAKAFNNKLAFKLNASYLQAKDWQATDYRDQSFNNGSTPGNPTNSASNPGYNGINIYGDENSSGAGLASLRTTLGQIVGLGSTPAGLAQLNAVSPGLAQLAGGINQIPAALRTNLINDVLLPNVTVNRTGYQERALVDYDTKSLKLSGALHYRFNDKLEGILQANWGSGTTVYTSSDRYYIKDFVLAQYKAELRGTNFFVRAYTTQERSGDAYAAGILGSYILEGWKPSAPAASAGLAGAASAWYPQYGLTYAGGAFQAFVPAFQQALAANPSNPLAAYQAAATAVNNPAVTGQIHAAARGVADAGMPMPGSTQFAALAGAITSAPIAKGAKFLDKTNLYHYEGMYNFRDQIDPKIVDLSVGANYRVYSLNSGGTLFLTKADGSEYDISEYGGYLQAIKGLGDQLKVTGSIRYDKNQNFDGQFSPRISAVFSPSNSQNFRASYQTGFRIPTTQNQYINLQTPVSLLIGGLQPLIDRYKLNDGQSRIFGSQTAANPGGTPYTLGEFKPERVLTFEVGYKGLIAQKLLVDAYYYNSTLRNFISGVVLLSPNVVSSTGGQIPISAPVNYGKDISYQGFGIGLEYALPSNFLLSGNLSNNTLNAGGVGLFSSEKNLNVLEDGTQIGFNTPKYRYNIAFANRNIRNSGWGFNVTYRYQQATLWQDLIMPAVARTSALNQQIIIPAFGTLDAQISKRIPGIKSILKLGGSNILQQEYRTGWGNPTIGSMYYLSLSFDELMR